MLQSPKYAVSNVKHVLLRVLRSEGRNSEWDLISTLYMNQATEAEMRLRKENELSTLFCIPRKVMPTWSW